MIGIRLKLLKLFGSDVQFQLRNRILVNQNVSKSIACVQKSVALINKADRLFKKVYAFVSDCKLSDNAPSQIFSPQNFGLARSLLTMQLTQMFLLKIGEL